MKKTTYLLPVMLVAVLFVALLIGMLVQVFQPAAILPPLNIPNMVALSLAALLLEHYITKQSQRCYWCLALFGIGAFGALPLMAGMTCIHEFWKYALVGGAVFTATAFLFTSAVKRLKTGPKAPAALVLTSLGIYLASQCFAGMIL